MAANVPAPAPGATARQESPLPSFDQVSKIVYLHKPTPPPSGNQIASGLAAPKLILIGGWMDARAPHLVKYTAKLQALYPASSIVLVRAFGYHFVSGGRKFPVEIAPAASAIRSVIAADEGGGGGPEMLVLVFSNGGATMLRHLYDVFRDTARDGESPRLPRHVTIFDSAPGMFSWSRSVVAFSMGAARSNFLVKFFVGLMAHMMSALYWVINVPWGRLGFLERSALAHNTRTVNQTEVARTYIYSKEDALIDYRHVESHAAQARERGYDVRLEMFEGTPHVAHARGDEGRYWAVVRDAWDRWTAK